MEGIVNMEGISAVLMEYGVRIVLAILIWAVGKNLIGFVLRIFEKRMDKLEVDQSLHSFLSPLFQTVLQILLLLSVAATLGIEITSFVAIVGGASLAVGLAFQGSLSNFAGGVLILFLKPFKVGDYIQAAGYSGTVKEIQIFYTILATPDNQKVIIPNADLSNSSAINYSAYDTRRANLKFAVRYDTDIAKAKEVIKGVVERHPLVLKDPAPSVMLGEHGEHGMIFYARLWATNANYWTVYWDMIEQVKEAFDEAGIEIPYQQLDVHLKQE